VPSSQSLRHGDVAVFIRASQHQAAGLQGGGHTPVAAAIVILDGDRASRRRFAHRRGPARRFHPTATPMTSRVAAILPFGFSLALQDQS
jgi:hypothetical protein